MGRTLPTWFFLYELKSSFINPVGKKGTIKNFTFSCICVSVYLDTINSFSL